MAWIAVGVAMTSRKITAEELTAEHTAKTFGPFDDADEARHLVNSLGLAGTGVTWIIAPLVREP